MKNVKLITASVIIATFLAVQQFTNWPWNRIWPVPENPLEQVESMGTVTQSNRVEVGDEIFTAYKIGFQHGSALATVEVMRQFSGMYVSNGFIELPNLNAYRFVRLPEILWDEQTNVVKRR